MLQIKGAGQLIDDAVRGAVHRQVQTGIDVPTDGEMGRVGFSSYATERLTVLARCFEAQKDEQHALEAQASRWELALILLALGFLLTASAEIGKTYRRGEMIVRQGHAGESFFVIVRGRVAVTILSPDGREVGATRGLLRSLLLLLRDGGATHVRPGTSDAEFAEAAAWLGRLRFGRP